MAKKNYKSDYNASVGKDDKFGMMYDGMAKSEAYQKLKCGEKLFYIICRIQARSKQGTTCLYKHSAENGKNYSENDFVFPAEHMELYGYDRSNGGKYLKALVEAGFIEEKENNKHRYKVNVYSFSSKWKEKK